MNKFLIIAFFLGTLGTTLLTFGLLSTNSLINPSPSLIKKGKRDYLEKLKQDIQAQGSSHIVTRFLKTGERPQNVSPPMDLRSKLVIPYKGCVTVMVEYNKKTKTGFTTGILPSQVMSSVARDASSQAIIVSMDSRLGGVTPDEFLRITEEQTRAEKFIPSPIPAIWCDFVVDKLQIEYAAALGASGITLQPWLTSDFADFVRVAKTFGMEPISIVNNLEDVSTAISAETNFLMFNDLKTVDSFIQLKDLTKAKYGSSNPDLVFLARLKNLGDLHLYNEVDAAWHLRDEGFHGFWPSPEALYSNGLTDFYSTIIAMRAKASREFLSAQQFLLDRPKEGATEFLGDILY